MFKLTQLHNTTFKTHNSSHNIEGIFNNTYTALYFGGEHNYFSFKYSLNDCSKAGETVRAGSRYTSTSRLSISLSCTT